MIKKSSEWITVTEAAGMFGHSVQWTLIRLKRLNCSMGERLLSRDQTERRGKWYVNLVVLAERLNPDARDSSMVEISDRLREQEMRLDATRATLIETRRRVAALYPSRPGGNGRHGRPRKIA